MTLIGDLALVAAIFVGPPLVLSTCVLLLVTRQARGVSAAAIACAVVAATAFVIYWYLWGKAFDYADANRPVPSSLGQASNIAVGVCLLSSITVAVLGASRLVVAWNNRPNSGLVPTT